MSDPTQTHSTEPADDWAAALAEQRAAASAGASETALQTPAQPANIFNRLTPGAPAADSVQDLDLILDIPVTLTVELGRTKIPIKHILQLAQGSVIELDALAGEPMDVLVNGCLIAQGEVVVVNEKFGIRLTDIVTPSERMRRLHK
ncbi:MAG: flagellar motor switch protein FliN [Sutterellaceae bacterium]|nr:flagellar motor switch protein FliN [Burkholderiaceae bacterium]MCX7902073.1 flagellar motor switch protein FliN [Burkholderiaceae bacterium]MDW8431009.1 flagellar motor switch protein FliN [Sutterellaceae bacterium]